MADNQDRRSAIAKLAREIVRNVDREPIHTELATSQRIIARVTDGIYREPWAAFRELIANAYDADATRVVVETGAPDFKQVIVRDNGNGMSPETVAYILKSIGGSSKRTTSGADLNTVSSEDANLSPRGRPLIGKIGIGLFSVAQLTQHFQIITKAAGSNIRTSATVQLRTHDEERVAQQDTDENYVAGDVVIASETAVSDDVASHGTTIILYSLRPEIRRNLQSHMRWLMSKDYGPDGNVIREAPTYHIGTLPNQVPGFDAGVESSLPWSNTDAPLSKFSALLRAAADTSDRSRSPANLEHFDEYLKLIWRLSLALPIQYADHHPFEFTGKESLTYYSLGSEDKAVRDLKLRPNQSLREKVGLSASDEPGGIPFTVLVDNVELRRPILLPTELRRQSRISQPMMLVAKVENAFRKPELKRAGGQLSFEAYLYWNSKIVPKETSGVLVRVREASGTLFDRSFLDYQTSEQNRLSQITAEIFVQEGLDSAINIDRESFNYSHPHFLYIQKWLHRAIRLLINKNKGLAKASLDAERQQEKVSITRERIGRAVLIWDAKRGDESDPPVQSGDDNSLPDEVGGIDIDWSKTRVESGDGKASAVAIVLEAYGVLASLSSKERARLIEDLLKVLDSD